MDYISYADVTQKVTTWFNTYAALGKAELVGKTIFGTRKTTEEKYEVQLMHGMKGIVEVAEDGEFPKIKGAKGDSKIYAQREFGGAVVVTKKARKFWNAKQGSIMTQVQTVTESTYGDIDQLAADTLTNGWSSTFVDPFGKEIDATCPNGKPLFSALHTNKVNSETFSNIITDGGTNNPVLGRAAIVETMARARKHREPTFDGKGMAKPVRLDTLLVGPDLEDLAYRICDSDKINNSNNNDTNKSLKRLTVKVWDRLAIDSQGNDHGAKWFMYDSKKVIQSVFYIISQAPTLYPAAEAQENKSLIYKIDAYLTVGRGWAAYIYGSKGTNS